MSANWNGATQRKRVEEDIAHLRERFRTDVFTMVRRRRNQRDWEVVESP